jgi:hypothetical protein
MGGAGMFRRSARRITLVALAAVLSLAAGCGDDAEQETADATVELPDAALEAYEDYTQTLLDADGEAMLDYVTDDFTFLSYGTNLMDAEFRADYVTENYGFFDVEEVGERTVVGGGDEYILSVPERATTPAVADGISVAKMVEIDGEWLVQAHRFLGEGEGSG